MCTTYAWALDWTGAYVLCVQVTCVLVVVGAGGYRTTVKSSLTAALALQCMISEVNFEAKLITKCLVEG